MEERFYCYKCKNLWDASELDAVVGDIVPEPFGSGVTTLPDVSVCPLCHNSDLEDGDECAICGEPFPVDEMVGYSAGHRICKTCLRTAVKNLDLMVEFGRLLEDDYDSFWEPKLNPLYGYVFSDSAVNMILEKCLKEALSFSPESTLKDLEIFAKDEDDDLFVDFLSAVEKKTEA